jgi:hypothetical protein
MPREITRHELRANDMVVVGDWGFGSQATSGHIVCRREDVAAVRAAYYAIEEGDLGPDVLDGVHAAGGEHVVGL